jgi:hypothetical protein
MKQKSILVKLCNPFGFLGHICPIYVEAKV